MAALLADHPNYSWSANWKDMWQELKDLLTDEQRAALSKSTQNAHFTFDLYRPIWQALERFGFAGGRVLEPAVGIGHAFGFMPAQMRQNSTLNATELEPFTATIAQALYPSARVQATGYEKARIPNGTQDLIISNVPFGPYGVRDSSLPQAVTRRIHNYFFAKALEQVRPGGYVVFVTSRYTMDGVETTAARRYLMDRAHFVGAIRLPNTAFDKTAKTEVITDLIILQKLTEGETARNAEAFIVSEKAEQFSTPKMGRRPEKIVYRSKWYDEHPELVLGQEATTGSMYGGNEYTVEATHKDLPAAIADALETMLPAGAYQAATTEATAEPERTRVEGAFKVNELRAEKGKIYRVNPAGEAVDVTPTKKNGDVDTAAVARIAGMVGVRDALRTTMATMGSATATDAAVEKTQKALNKVYTAFVKAHGYLNDKTNKRLFAIDPESPNLTSLEIVTVTSKQVPDKKRGGTILRLTQEITGKSDIFTKRVIRAPAEIQSVATPQDALMASLNSRMQIDWSYMARIFRGETKPSVVRELQTALTESGSVFETPGGAWVLAGEYLSGNVVTKLADAQAAADEDPRFTRNVEALTAVQPTPKTTADIADGTVGVGFGSHWIPTTDVEAFLDSELDSAGTAKVFLDAGETFVRWSVNFTGDAERAGNSHPLAVRYGPKRGDADQPYVYGFTELVNDALNLNTPSLGWYEGTGDDRVYVKDPVGTEAARANVDEVRQRWLQWIYTNEPVQDRLVQLFNERFNRTIARKFDGSHLQHLDENGERLSGLPGLALPFRLFKHQLDAIWRVLSSGNTLLAHEVGAGKTFEMIVAAMEMRRTGRARKPLIAVPTNLLQQWRDDIFRAYPAAKVLAFDAPDLIGEKRQAAMARIAMGDWDIVLVPHSSFGLLKVSEERMIDMLQKWVDEIMDAESAARAERGQKDPSVKKLAAIRSRLEDKIDARIEAIKKRSKDNNLTWEQLGVDALLIDEAHEFKNLYFYSKVDNIRGLSRSESDKALDMFVKIQSINEQSNYRNLIFATATPVMNSMAEIYTMQRYLQPEALRELGVEGFDNWYAMFAEAVVRPEQRPDGSYHEVRRLRKFRNLELLYRTFSNVMDYIGWDDMPYLKLPKLEGDRVTVVETDPHPIYEQLRRWFTDRLDAIKANPPRYDHVNKRYIAPDRPDALTGKPTGKPDLVLTVMNDARMAAIDPRLVLGNRATDWKGSRLQRVAEDLMKVYTAEKDAKGAQLVFIDVGTPKDEDLKPLEFLGKHVAVEETDEATDVDESTEEDDGFGEDAGRFNLYEALKSELVKRGVPSRQIAFVHQAKKAAERKALFEAVNNGTVRFLFASTRRGSVGMNVQRRLAHVAHFDVPRDMRPGDLRQRDGRIIRQGNTYERIQISRYVTKGTTDEWLYGLLGNKQDIVGRFMRGDMKGEYEEQDPSTMSIEEAQAAATGDPRQRELIDLRTQLRRLEAQAEATQRARAQAQVDQERLSKDVPRLRAQAAAETAWITEHQVPMRGTDFQMTIGGETFTKAAKANEALITAVQTYGDTVRRMGQEGQPKTLGSFGGVDIVMAKPYGYGDIVVNIQGGPFRLMATNITVPHHNEPIGAGRNIVASAVDKYETLAMHAKWTEAAVVQGETDLARAKKVLAQPADAVTKFRAVQARVREIEEALKRESDEREKARGEEKKQKAAEAAEDAKKKSSESSGGGGASSGGDFRSESTDDSIGSPRDPEPATAPSGETLRPIEFPELVALVREWINTPELAVQIVKAFRKPGKLGEFRAGAKAAGIRLTADLFTKGRERELAAVLAHEMGHLIDWLPTGTLKRGNLIGRLWSLRSFLKGTFTTPGGTTIKNPEIKKELQTLSALWRPWDPATTDTRHAAYRNSAVELYADAISVLFRDPGLLETTAPTFFNQFFEALDEKPDVKRAYFELQEFLTGTRDQLVQKRLERESEMFERGKRKAVDLHRAAQAKREASKKGAWFHFRYAMADLASPILDKVAEAEQAGAVIPEDQNPAYWAQERNYVGARQKGWLEREIVPLFEALRAEGVSWDDFGKTLFHERVLAGDRSEMANPGGFAPDAVEEMQAALEANLTPTQRKTLRDAVTKFREAQAAIVAEAHDAGLLTDEQLKQMQENPAYATFRVIEHMDENVNWKTGRQKGTLKDIDNPGDASVLKLLSTIWAIERNRMAQSTVGLLRQYFPKEIQAADTRWEGTKKGHVAIEPRDPDLGLVLVWKDGKLQGHYVDAYIAKSLQNETIGQNKAIMAGVKLLHAPIFRSLFTTFNAGFQTMNFQRDFLRMWQNAPGMSFLGAMKGYWNAGRVAKLRAFGIKPSDIGSEAWETLTQAEEAKILGVTYNDLLADKEPSDTQLEDILSRKGVDQYGSPESRGVWEPVLKFLDFLKALGDFVETLPKVATMNHLRGDLPVSALSPKQRAFIRRMVGSPDFLTKGTLSPATNALFLYSNAAIQGTRSDLQLALSPGRAAMPMIRKQIDGQWTWVARPSGFWWKMAATVILPKLLMAAVLEAIFGDKLRRILQGGSSEYDRTNYTVVPLREDAKGNGIVWRVPMPESNRLIGGIFWKILRLAKGDKDVAETMMQVVDYTAGQIPSMSPIIEAGTAAAEMAAGRNHYDLFRSRPVLTDDEMAAGGWRKWQKFLLWEFQALGGDIVMKVNVSEKQANREKTAAQMVLEFPILSNVLGRSIKISQYGETERLREAAAPVKQAEAERRLTVRESITEAAQRYRALPASQQTPATQMRTAHGIVQTLYQTPEDRQAKFPEVLKRLRLSIVAPKADPIIDAVTSATSNDQKVAILAMASEQMTATEYQSFLVEGVRTGVISENLYGAARAEMQKRRRRIQ